MDYLIREASIDDLNSVVGLWQKLSIDQMSKDIYYKGELVFEEGHSQFQDALTNSNCCIFVAEVDNIIVGFIEVWLYQKDFHFFIDDYAYIIHFFVDTEARKSKRILGIVYKLFEVAQNWSIQRGKKFLVADVFSHNPKVMKLLERVGLKSYRTRYVKEIGELDV